METTKKQSFAIFIDLAESTAQTKWQQLEAKEQNTLSSKNTYPAEYISWLEQTLLPFSTDKIESWNGPFSSLQNSTIAWIYQIGHDFVEKQQFAEALSIFSQLTLLSPKSSDVWIAQGFAQKRLAFLQTQAKNQQTKGSL